MVAVLRQQVVGGPEKLFGHFADDGVDLGRRGKREAVEKLASEGAAGRLGAGRRPVDARLASVCVAAVGVFAAVDDDAGVEKGCSEEPEGRGDAAGLEKRKGTDWLLSFAAMGKEMGMA